MLGILLAGETLGAEVLARVQAAGHPRVRYAHGFLFQVLVPGPRAVGDVAAALGISSQAVSKAVAELEALGYVERGTDDEDARVRRVQLSGRGREALAATRRARERLQGRLASRAGEKTVKDARRLLARLLDELGGAGAVRRRRVTAPR